MRCGIILNRLLAPHRAPTGEMFGAAVAENQLIEAALLVDEDLRWDLISCDVSGRAGSITRSNSDGGNLHALSSSFPERITAIDARDLASIARSVPYVFVTSAPLFPRLAEFRLQSALTHIPICCLVHSLNTPNFSHTYSSLLIYAEPYDVIVASSHTARTALEAAFTDLRTMLASRFRSSELLELPTVVDIPFGVNVPSKEQLNVPNARRCLGIGEDRFVALYLGRLSDTYKADLDILLRTIRTVARDYPNLHLVLAGQADEPAYIQVLRKRASMLGITDRLTIIENFPDFVKPQIIAGCNTLILPSDSIQETFGLAVLEGMAYAKPVIAASWSGYRDLITDNETGYLVRTMLSRDRLDEASSIWPLADARALASLISRGTILREADLTRCLHNLISDSHKADRMGETGRKHVLERYTWSIISKRFCALWADRFRLSEASVSRSCADRISYQQIFERYADGAFESSGTIRLAPDAGDLQEWGGELTPGTSALMHKLQGSAGEVSIGALRTAGASLSDLLWLLKKGVCDLN